MKQLIVFIFINILLKTKCPDFQIKYSAFCIEATCQSNKKTSKFNLKKIVVQFFMQI